jgi:hypothetical protein
MEDCQNILILEGDEKEIRRFIKQAKNALDDGDELYTTDFSFEKFIPAPKELSVREPKDKERSEALIKKYGCDNWFAWRFKNLGLIGEPVDVLFEEDQNKYRMSFSDEEHIDEAISIISRQYPSITFRLEYFYFELGNGDEADYGRYEIENGQIKVEEEGRVYVLFCPACGYVEGQVKIESAPHGLGHEED